MDFKVVEIIKDRELLSPEYMPTNIISRENEINELKFQLSYFFRDYPSLPSFIVHGTSGTGKTLVVKKVLKDFKEKTALGKHKVKTAFIKCSECRSKYEVLKAILRQLTNANNLPRTSADCYEKIVHFLYTSDKSVLLFIDEIHELKNPDELNNLLFTISRFGEDKAYYETTEQEKLSKTKTHYGYILITNDSLITKDLKQNTKSSLTKERVKFLRYTPEEVAEILQERINQGAFHPSKIDEVCINLISALSIAEGEDARYGLLLLSNTAKYAEKHRCEITQEIVRKVNDNLRSRLLLEIIIDLPSLYKTILKIILDLHNAKMDIDSKKIYEHYNNDALNKRLNYSRISQIITFLEKEKVIYVKGSNGNNLRKLAIGENLEEIKQVLSEEGFI